MKKINVIIGTNNFGLGPVGKVSSIINFSKSNINWYACGNAFDLNIFKANTFKDILFTKNKEEIKEFVKKYNIKYSVVVLDVELSKILLDLDVKVIFVDSLPFMWTQADIDEGLLPLDATVYCAQKCINLTDSSKEILNQIENLRWINPISNTSNKKFRPFKEKYIHINVGGLHSPIGNGESYVYTIIIPILKVLLRSNVNILITGGTNACKTINRILEEKAIKTEKLKVLTLEQNKFLSSVYNSELFLTSPGLTTIYETANLKKETIVLPPQNLSQFYNIEFAKKILDKYKTINWETSKLNYASLKKILSKGETFVVEEIYKYITQLIDTDFVSEFEERFAYILNKDYDYKEETNFEINSNGAEDISKIIIELGEKYERF